jgi:hypothetical protein
MSMNAYLAIGIAEGFEVAESQEQFIEAWQFLIDSGLAWRLQGWYGRTASHLIGEGPYVKSLTPPGCGTKH